MIAAVRTAAALDQLPVGLDQFTPLVLDVADQESITQAAQSIAPLLDGGGLNALVNNGGVVVQGPVELVPAHALRRQLEINVIGQIAVTQAFLPALRRAGGRVVNIVPSRPAPPYRSSARSPPPRPPSPRSTTRCAWSSSTRA